MKRALPIAVAVVMLAVSGIVHGIWTNRWGASMELQSAAAELDNLPMNLGEWRGQPMTIDAEQLAMAEVEGYVARVYRHPNKGEASVVVLCGRPGPIAVHTPDVCYPGSGYQPTSDAESVRVSLKERSSDAAFRMLRLRKAGPTPEHLHVFWAWNGGSGWTMPENPRLTFARSEVLYKLYVVRRPAKADEPAKDDSVLDLLRVLLPALEKLSPPA